MISSVLVASPASPLMGSIRRSLGAVAVLGMVLTSSARAQDDARAKLLIPEGGGLASEVGHFPRGAPGTSTGSPIAYGANWGDLYGGAGFETPSRYVGGSDGAVTVGLGFLNSSNFVGFDVAITSLSTVNTGFGKRMGLGAKLHRLLPDNWGIAAGVTGIYLHNMPVDAKASVYGVISKVFDLQDTPFKALTLSAGAGNENFRLQKDIRNNNQTFGAFGSVALRVWDPLAVIVDWPGQDLNVGLSIVPFKNFPIVLTPAVADITGSAGKLATSNSSRLRFTMGAGMAVRF